MEEAQADSRLSLGGFVFLWKQSCFRIMAVLCACAACVSARAAVLVSAGRPFEGNPSHASGGMRELDRFDLPQDEDHIACGVLDAASGYAWFGADSGDREARIYKVRLEPGAAVPRLVATVSLDERHLTFTKAMIDPAAGYAWFAGEISEGSSVLYKVALGDGEAPPSLTAALPLAMSEIRSGAIDPGRGCLLIGGRNGQQGILAKIALGAGAAPPSLVSSVFILDDEWGPRCSAIDTVTGHVWLGIRSVTPHIAKYDIGPADAAPIRLGSVDIPQELGRPSSFVIDSQARFGYIGTQVYDADGWIVKINLGAGDAAPALVGARQLENGDGSILRNSGVLASGRNHVLFCTESSPPRLLKFALTEDETPPALISRLVLGDDERPVSCLLADESTGLAYIGTNTNPAAHVIKVDCGRDTAPMQRLACLTLPGGERLPACVLMDTQHGYAYYGTEAAPARIVKVKLGDGVNPPRRLGSLILQPGEDDARCGLIDPDAGCAWFGLGTSPGRIVKIALGANDALPTRLGSMNLAAGEDYLACAVFDATRQAALWGTATNPGIIVKTSLGPGLPARIGALPLPTGSKDVKCAIADPLAGLAWFGTGTFPGKVIKVSFGPAAGPPERLTAIEMPGTPDGAEGNFHSAFIDTATGYGWFKGCQGALAINTLSKIDLGGATDPPRRVGGVQFSVDYSSPLEAGAVKGYYNRNGYLIGGYPGSYAVIKSALGEGPEMEESLNRLLLADPLGVRCAAIDPAFDDGYFGNVRVRLSARNLVVGSRVNIPEPACVTTVTTFAYIPEGNLRLALYSAATTPTLLWQSPSPIPLTRQGWIHAPVVTGGGKGLVLPAGDCWLAWQVDSRKMSLGSMGNTGQGFYVKFPNGPFPAKLPPVGSGDSRASLQVFSGTLQYPVPEINFQARPVPYPSRGTPLYVDVVLSDPAPTTVTAKIKIGGNARAGQDFLFMLTDVKFHPGESRKSFPYSVIENTPDEGDEFFSLTLAQPSGARVGPDGSFIHTITNDDPRDRLMAGLRGSPTVMEGNYCWAWFNFEVNGIGVAGPIEADVETVECGQAAAGRDFVTLRQHLVIPAGSRSVPFAVEILNDELPENPEQFQVRLANVKGAQAGADLATVTILDRGPGRVIPYLLGMDGNEAGLDHNADGRVTIADELYRVSALTPGPFGARQPADGATNAPSPVLFKWDAPARAENYDLYVWPASQAQPRSPFKTRLYFSGFEDTPKTLKDNTDYCWQAVARNAAGLTAGPVFRFRSSPLFMELDAPTSGTVWTRGTAVKVHWRVNTRQAGDAVWFELWRGGSRVATLGSDYNKTGDAEKTLRLPADLAPASDYRLRLVSDYLRRILRAENWIECAIAIR